MPDNIDYRDGFNEDGTLQPFSLPRGDWYDEEGRIYKDILIENFNTIQDKLLQLSQLTPFNTTPPDITQVVYPDVTLDSPEDKIVNVKSLVDILKLKGYPLVSIFSGNVIKELTYYNNNYSLTTIKNVTTTAKASTPYVYLNYVTNSINVSASETTPTNCLLIGYFSNGTIKSINGTDYSNINLLWVLSQMSIETKDIEMKNSEWFRDQWVEKGWKLSGGTVGATDLDTRSGSDLGTVTFNRIGRK